MKSKLEELKEHIGFTEDYPCCKNCKNFTFDIVASMACNGVIYNEKKNLRCDFSDTKKFKVGLSTYCDCWSRKPNE